MARSLARLLAPRSVAIVGASDTVPNAGAQAMLERGLDVIPVNPRRATVYGLPAAPSLASLDRPVDAVLSLLAAEPSIDVVAEAAAIGAGGAVVIAGGFGGDSGLLDALRAAAGTLPVVGPNCNGLANARCGAVLSGAPPLRLAAGGIALVTQSGGFLAPVASGGRARRLGFSHLVSTGSEAVVDVGDVIDALVADPDVRVVALVLETVRRPQAFLEAAERARRAGKPIVALRLGRSAAGAAVTRSHTGALAGDARAYEAAFRRAGIVAAGDVPDLLDCVALLEQLPRERWSAARGVAILSTSGGMAALAGDLAEQERIELPALERLQPVAAALVAEAAGAGENPPAPNPVDLTGFLGTRPDLLRRAFDSYLEAPEVDALVFVWLLDEGAGAWAPHTLEPLVEAAAATSKPVVVASLEDGEVAAWADAYLRRGLLLGRGLRGALRGLRAMGEAVRAVEATRPAHAAPPPPPVPPVPLPRGVVRSAAGPVLAFGAAMELLAAAGVPVAPYALAGHGRGAELPFAAPYVVKLANVPHRTELGAVRTGVGEAALGGAVAELRRLAADAGLPDEVVVQPQLAFEGEAFVGVDGRSSFGPLVLVGAGGTLVELLGEVVAALAPLSEEEAAQLLEELPPGLVGGARGASPWDLAQLARIIAAVSGLAAGAPWLRSLDVNPLLHGPRGFVAVDALCIVNEEGSPAA